MLISANILEKRRSAIFLVKGMQDEKAVELYVHAFSEKEALQFPETRYLEDARCSKLPDNFHCHAIFDLESEELRALRIRAEEALAKTYKTHENNHATKP